jgi:dTDP-4-dehydrorhamnose 3,5-epimerase-like enzyme|tara:strand:- start:1442 stop:1834 length:393 start_codon:yes stop_codon:yes gene_type:complete
MSKTDLGIFLENFDKRGSVFRGDFKKKEIFLITEVKKGKSRGGHYHTNVVNHHVLYGKIMYKEIRLTKNGKVKKNFKEIRKIVSGGKVITTPAYASHIFFGLENSIVFETSGGNKKSITYQPYREQISNL